MQGVHQQNQLQVGTIHSYLYNECDLSKNQHGFPLVCTSSFGHSLVNKNLLEMTQWLQICTDDRVRFTLWVLLIWIFCVFPNRFYKSLDDQNNYWSCKPSWFLHRSQIVKLLALWSLCIEYLSSVTFKSFLYLYIFSLRVLWIDFILMV